MVQQVGGGDEKYWGVMRDTLVGDGRRQVRFAAAYRPDKNQPARGFGGEFSGGAKSRAEVLLAADGSAAALR